MFRSTNGADSYLYTKNNRWRGVAPRSGGAIRKVASLITEIHVFISSVVLFLEHERKDFVFCLRWELLVYK